MNREGQRAQRGPAMKAGAIAGAFITTNNRWCDVDWLTFEVEGRQGRHILGDSTYRRP